MIGTNFNVKTTHVILRFLIAAGLGEQRVAAHIVLGTGCPMQRRLARNIDFVRTFWPQAHEILQYLGVAQPGGLVDDIKTIAILGGDKSGRHRWLQLHLQCLQIVIDHRLVQILCGVLQQSEWISWPTD